MLSTYPKQKQRMHAEYTNTLVERISHMCADGAFTPGFSKYSEPGAGVVGAAQNGRPSGSTALLLWWTMGGRHFTAFPLEGKYRKYQIPPPSQKGRYLVFKYQIPKKYRKIPGKYQIQEYRFEKHRIRYFRYFRYSCPNTGKNTAKIPQK